MSYKFDRLKVLVADDNQHMRHLVMTILQAFGVIQIFEAEDGEQAWASIRENSPDVAFLDWMMPGMCGIELVRLVRTSPITPNPFLPIVMLTGYSQVENVRQARDAGINEFLAKPVSVNGVMTRLAAVIESPRPFVRTKVYFGPCRRRRGREEYKGPERRVLGTENSQGAKAA